jgi:hypothetical protein
LADLERDLRALAEEIDWPPTPKFLPPYERAEAGWGPRRRWLLAAAAILLVAAIAVAAIPQTRDAVATFLGLRGVVVQKVPNPPTPSPLPPGPLGERLGLGDRVTLEQAGAQAHFHVLVPAQVGQPEEVYFNSGRRMVTLVYAARPGLPQASETGVGLLVAEFPGQLAEGSMGKMLGPGSTLTPVDMGGGAAYFISGQHVFYFFNGPGRADESRLAANTLIWQRGKALIRIEGNLSQQQAIEIARSLE